MSSTMINQQKKTFCLPLLITLKLETTKKNTINICNNSFTNDSLAKYLAEYK